MISRSSAATDPTHDASDWKDAELPYRNAWEHLRDELERLRLNLLLRMRGSTHRQPADRLEGFQGLVVSEQEVATLLHDMGARNEPASRDTHTAALTQSLDRIRASIASRVAASARNPVALPLVQLAKIFGLSPFEVQSLVIAAAPDLDVRYEKVFAFIQDDVTRKRPTAALIIELLCQGSDEGVIARAAFATRAPLYRYYLCRPPEAASDLPSLSRPLKVDDRIVEFLLGRQPLDACLTGAAQLVKPEAEPSPVAVDAELADRITRYLDTTSSGPAGTGVVIHLLGRADAGKRALVEEVCRRERLALVVADVDRLANSATAFDELVVRLGREALLQPAALCIDEIDALARDPERRQFRIDTLFDAVAQFSPLTFILGSEPLTLRRRAAGPTTVTVEVPLPDVAASARLWGTYFAREANVADEVNADDLGNRFRLGPGTMHEAVVVARGLAQWRKPEDPRITTADLATACRTLTASRLNTMARKITPRQAWGDLVLPADQLAQLNELCNQARYRHVVHGAWGFERKLPLGKGINALFSGPSGTGKTMAAQVIASELQLDLYQIDLSQVISKYIGETEKNLKKVFDEADASQAILFFDEADAIFGKRSEVKDAHDRYANIEVGYLLQRMEEYEGIAILATNLRQNVDDAFVRRLRFIVEFPFPDETHRRRIWEVTFPPEAPLAEDVDLGQLARELKQLAGGNIKNVAVSAAFGAAADGRSIALVDLQRAARREYQKLGKSWSEPAPAGGER